MFLRTLKSLSFLKKYCFYLIFIFGFGLKTKAQRSIDSVKVAKNIRGHFLFSDKYNLQRFYDEELQHIPIKNGDIVADIGASDGWFSASLSVFTDSVTYYIQDIDEKKIDNYLWAEIKYISGFRNTSQNNRFVKIVGTKTQTNLPNGTFDVIILRNTLHELKDKDSIINDLIKKIKPTGKIIFIEQFSTDEIQRRNKGCGIKAYKFSSLETKMKQAGYYITNMSLPSFAVLNIVQFEKDEAKSLNYSKKRKMLDSTMNTLFKLKDKNFVGDDGGIRKIQNDLLNKQDNINEVYPNFKYLISSIGFHWVKKKRFHAATQILKINQKLYPKSDWSYLVLGECFWRAKNLSYTYQTISEAIRINPDNRRAKAIKLYIDELKKSSVEIDWKHSFMIHDDFIENTYIENYF